jgi:CubicO group peptidase (beta-lactamase class C family)
MRVREIKFHFARYFVVSLFLSFFAFGLGCASAPKQFSIDKFSPTEDSEYRLDKEKISEAVNKIEAGEFGKIHSLIIIQNDEVIIEKYFRGWQRHKLHEIFSVTKSVTSSLIGMAIEQGLIEGVDLKLVDLFPEYDHLENMDPRKKMITLENLLTMTAGYRWNELSVPYKNSDGSWNPNNDIVKMHSNSKDFIKYVLDLPLVDDPGKKYTYNTGCSILLAGIIKRKTGKSAEEYGAEHLFKPLGITQWKWLKSPDGTTDTGGGLFMYPADMAMFGYLYLKNGKVNGQQIVSESWVNQSTERRVSTRTGEYGYQWWRFKKSSGEKYSELINTSYFAVGIGDQTIFVIPKANMVVVSTADNLLHKGRNIYNLFFEQIIPALKSKEDSSK